MAHSFMATATALATSSPKGRFWSMVFRSALYTSFGSFSRIMRSPNTKLPYNSGTFFNITRFLLSSGGNISQTNKKGTSSIFTRSTFAPCLCSILFFWQLSTVCLATKGSRMVNKPIAKVFAFKVILRQGFRQIARKRACIGAKFCDFHDFFKKALQIISK